MAATPAMLQFALRLQPAEVCLVPENRAEVASLEKRVDELGLKKSSDNSNE
jgi:pyridoxine 5'-phosphate synthase PdxJ